MILPEAKQTISSFKNPIFQADLLKLEDIVKNPIFQADLLNLEDIVKNLIFQADLLNLEDIVGSGRLPTHIFLLDSLSLLRNQVPPYLSFRCIVRSYSLSSIA